jgi:hypothetical protein
MDRDRDFADAFEAAFAGLRQALEAACAAEAQWPERAAGAIVAALEFAAAQPGTARVLLSDPFANGLYGALRHRRMVAHLAALLEEGRQQRADAGIGLPPITEEALVGGAAEVVAERLRSGHETTIPALAPELIELVLAPYVGAETARRIAADPAVG